MPNFSVISMAMILPTIFGLGLVGEGLHKVLNERMAGWVSVVMGLMFIGAVIFAVYYLY
jgi:threonine/homoserine/homoserine lactone efflux protein